VCGGRWRVAETATYSTPGGVGGGMTKTVDELRNEIRVAVGRSDRLVSTAFTKEALAAICERVGYEIGSGSLPSKPQMRAGILAEIGELESDDPEQAGSAFRKGELEAIAAALETD